MLFTQDLDALIIDHRVLHLRFRQADGDRPGLLVDSRPDLAEVDAGRDIAVVTRTSDIPDTPGARLQRICDERAAALYSLLMPRPASASDLLTPHPYIFE